MFSGIRESYCTLIKATNILQISFVCFVHQQQLTMCVELVCGHPIYVVCTELCAHLQIVMKDISDLTLTVKTEWTLSLFFLFIYYIWIICVLVIFWTRSLLFYWCSQQQHWNLWSVRLSKNSKFNLSYNLMRSEFFWVLMTIHKEHLLNLVYTVLLL